MFKFAIAISFLMAAGCAGQTSKDYGYMVEREYRSKPQIRQALIQGNEMTESAVQKMLAGKVKLPGKVNLAVVRLSDSAEGLDFQTIDEELAKEFYDKAKWGPRVQTLIPVPQVMLAKPVTLAGLRQAAVLLQADALLIVKPMTYADYKVRLFDENKAKSVTSLEVLLLDTRTSVVPFTSVITESAEVVKNKADYGDYEMMTRSRLASEAKALLKVAPAMEKFITKAM